MIIGYARVSSKEQNLDRQIEELNKFGIDRLFVEKQSGKDFNRPVYQEMKSKLRFGDVLVIQDLSRLGRNREQIIEEWEFLNKEDVSVVVLNMPLLDTRNKVDGVGGLISNIVLQVMSWMVEEERKRIRANQKQGIAIAKDKGVYKGRKRVFTEDNPRIVLAFELLDSGKYSKNQICEMTGLSKPTFFRRLKERNVAESKR